MHRFFSGSCTMKLRLAPVGPWMVRGQTISESFTDSRGKASMRDVLQPLLDVHNDGHKRPVLPASSLKGVLRSTAERILRSIDPERPDQIAPLADDPFIHRIDRIDREKQSQEIFNAQHEAWLRAAPRSAIADSELIEWYAAKQPPLQPPAIIYPALSAASQLFGATPHRGMVTLEDAHPRVTPVRRSHVAIDRFTGGVGEGPFLEEIVPPDTPLETTLTITNFALYQIGLLALTFQEISLGYAGIGGGTRKGQGQVKISVDSLTLRYAHRPPEARGVVSAQARLAGPPWNAASLVPEAVQREGDLTLLEELAPSGARDWREARTQRLELGGGLVEQLFVAAVQNAWWPWVEIVRREGR